MKQVITLWILVIAFAATTFVLGYAVAWDKQEVRRLECGAGWYQSLELVAELLPYWEAQ